MSMAVGFLYSVNQWELSANKEKVLKVGELESSKSKGSTNSGLIDEGTEFTVYTIYRLFHKT